MAPAQFIPTTQGSVDPEIINLSVGHPQDKFLPMDRLRRAAEARFAAGDPYFMQYGIEQGDGYLRLHLADFLSKGYGFPVNLDDVLITNGASMGLALACSLFTQPGDTIFVEEPTYFLAFKVFRDYHLKVISLPVDENGMVIEALEEALQQHHPSLIYSVPTFQNPSGYTLSEERRVRLVALSRQHNFLIVADEVYHFLNYTCQPPTPFSAYISEGNIVSLSSFSKILAPGLRLGWIQSDPQRIEIINTSGLLDSGGGLNPFTSAIVRGVLETGELEANISELRQVYASRMQAMDAALRQHIPGISYRTPQGGYFFWLRLPGGLDAEDLLKVALDRFKVKYTAGVRFSSRAGLRDYFRLCFAYYEAEDLVEGILRIKQALEVTGG